MTAYRQGRAACASYYADPMRDDSDRATWPGVIPADRGGRG